jgi:hypothetical protein
VIVAFSDGANALYTILSTFNLIVLVAVILLFLYIVVVGVFGTAHQGNTLRDQGAAGLFLC